MKVELIDIGRAVPYARDPRKNEAAVAKVAASIKEFGWRQPIVVDSDMGIVVGHTRYLAAQQPGIQEIPVYVADRVSLAQIATAVEDLGQLAKAHRITPDELPGCGFRVTNSGPKGNLFGTAMINQPRIGIVRLGQVVKGPVFVEKDGRNAIAIGPIISLVVAYDHRIIDGATGNGFIFWGLLDTRTWVVF